MALDLAITITSYKSAPSPNDTQSLRSATRNSRNGGHLRGKQSLSSSASSNALSSSKRGAISKMKKGVAGCSSTSSLIKPPLNKKIGTSSSSSDDKNLGNGKPAGNASTTTSSNSKSSISCNVTPKNNQLLYKQVLHAWSDERTMETTRKFVTIRYR